MTATEQRCLYQLRPGTLDEVGARNGVTTDEELAALVGVSIDQLAALRYRTAAVTTTGALQIWKLLGCDANFGLWFDTYKPQENHHAA